MKRLALALFFTTATLFAQTNPDSPPVRSTSSPRTIAASFWNIQWFPGRRPNPSIRDEVSQINAVHTDIAQINPDIVGLEEVRDFSQAAVAVQPLSEFKVDVCANFPPREGQPYAQEVAIARRLQSLGAWAESWKTAGAMTPPRGFAFAAYEIAPRQLLLVYAVHLKSNRGDILENTALRQESVRQLRSHIAAMEQAYGRLGALSSIIGGDFNSSLDDPRFAAGTTLRELMKAGFLWCGQNIPAAPRMTLPPARDFPAAAFDHIFYRSMTLRRYWVANTSPHSSDHRAVVATFELPAPTE